MKWFLLELLTSLNMSSIVHKLKLLTVQGGRTRLFFFFCCLAKYRCSLPSLQRIKNKKWFFFSSRTLFAKRNMKFNFICTNLMFGWILKTFWTLMQYMQTARSRFPLVSIREITLRRLKQKNKSIARVLFKVSQHSQCHQYIIWSLFNASLSQNDYLCDIYIL